MVVGSRAGLKDGEQSSTQGDQSGRRYSAEILRNLMSRFAINTPYLIIVVCLIIAILGAVSVVQMPVDMFPAMNIPVVVVATFYAGMPPEQIEGDITYHLERFFTFASGIDHIESRSLNGVSIIRVYFQSNTNADIDAATIANLAVSDMKDLPPGTLPPVVLKSDASSLPVCLVTMNGEGMTRRQPEGHRAELRSQSTGERSRRVHSAAVRRTMASDPVLCRSRTSWKPGRSVRWTWCGR